MEKYLLIATVLRPKGLNGIVKLRIEADSPSLIMKLNRVYSLENGKYEEHKISSITEKDGFVFLRLDECSSLEEAEKLRNLMLYMDRNDAPKLPEGVYYIADLIGSQITLSDGRKLGTLINVLQPGANDVYVVKTENNKEILVPAISKLILKTDIINQAILLDSEVFYEVTYED